MENNKRRVKEEVDVRVNGMELNVYLIDIQGFKKSKVTVFGKIDEHESFWIDDQEKNINFENKHIFRIDIKKGKEVVHVVKENDLL